MIEFLLNSFWILCAIWVGIYVMVIYNVNTWYNHFIFESSIYIRYYSRSREWPSISEILCILCYLTVYILSQWYCYFWNTHNYEPLLINVHGDWPYLCYCTPLVINYCTDLSVVACNYENSYRTQRSNFIRKQ